MRCPVNPIAAFVDDLVRNRRPCRFMASPEELDALHAAVQLAGLRPGANRPDCEFVEHVYASIGVTVGRMFP